MTFEEQMKDVGINFEIIDEKYIKVNFTSDDDTNKNESIQVINSNYLKIKTQKQEKEEDIIVAFEITDGKINISFFT